MLLTASALERINEPNDWLRREIEHAIDTKRNIVPLTMEGFDWKDAAKHLTGKLSVLSSYNALRVPADYFMEAMTKLYNKHLNIELDAVLHPRNSVADEAAKRVQKQAEGELLAWQYFHKAQETDIPDKKIEYFTTAIKNKTDFAQAYRLLGWTKYEIGLYNEAYLDISMSIEIDAHSLEALFKRATIQLALNNLPQAIQDFDKVLQIKPGWQEARDGLVKAHTQLKQQ